jgi:mannose-6-phosphate isomerase-like protein (cupin superfamily)
MKTAILRIVGIALIVSPAVGFAQSKTKPTAAYYITKEEVDTVNKTPGVDRTIRVMDIGDQHFSVGIIHRGSTTQPAAAAAAGGAGRAGGAAAAGGGAGRAGGAAPAPPANTQPCGETVPAAQVPAGLSSGLYHNKQTEGYYIVSGEGMIVTGGHIVNGRTSAPDSEVTTTLNGPSCSGRIAGNDVVKRMVKTGDIVIIPAGVPHGWAEIAEHVDYLSFRPSSDILTVGYQHPSLKK